MLDTALTNEIAKIVTEVIVVLVGSFGSIVLAKAKHYLDGLKKKDELGIIGDVTNTVVHYAEAELTGSKGEQKRDFAVDKALSILASKGISVSKDEVIAGIEEGVNKLRLQQVHIASIASEIPAQEAPVEDSSVQSASEVQAEQPAQESVSK